MRSPGRVNIALALVLLLASAARSATTTQTASTRDENVDAVEYLSSTVYAKLLNSPDWLDRSLGLISLARLPGHGPTEMILHHVQTDATPAVRIVAWQCLLARAKSITPTQYKKWREATAALVKADAFRGQTRVGLIRMLALEPPTQQTRRLWCSLFDHTSAMEQQDVPVLDALGDCLKAWRSPELLKFLGGKLDSPDDAYRAEYLLHHAGVDAPWAGEHSDVGFGRMWEIANEGYAKWWHDNGKDWKEIKHPEADNPWRNLEAQFIPAADPALKIDRFDEKWKKELEIGTPDLRGLDVVFVVDATGSMQWLLDYLKRDITRILRATALVSGKPRIGITFYRDQGDMFVTRSVRLTEHLPELQAAISNISAEGGEDTPEAVYEALVDALSNNPWRWEKSVRRAVVLITDAPPHPQTQEACERVARDCKEHAVTLYVVKASADELPQLNALASAAGGHAVAVKDLHRTGWPYPLPQLRGNTWYTRLATAPGEDPADLQILTGLLADAINPDFRDRLEPLVAIMLALTTEYVPEKREIFGVASPDEGPHDPGRGPQAR
jgi:hypothetical protein